MIDDRQRREKNSPLKVGSNCDGLIQKNTPTWVAHSRGAPTQL